MATVTSPSVPSLPASLGWRVHLSTALHSRDRVQRDNYVDLISAYTALLSQLHSLRSRVRQQDTDLSSLRTQLSLTSSSSFSSPSSTSFPNASSSSPDVSAALKEKLATLQEELSHAWRLQAESNASSLRLKESSERDEKALLVKEEEGKALKAENEQLRLQLQLLKEEKERKEKLIESTVEVVRREYHTVKLALENSEKDRQRLTNENDVLVSRVMRAKEDAVKQVNELNDLVRKKGIGGGVGKDKSAEAEQKRVKEEEEEDRKRGDLLSFDIDMTSSGAIIDSLSWQQHVQVIVPQEKKRTVYVHRGAQCMTVTYSPSGQWVVSGGSDGYIKLIDARTGILKAQLRGSPESVMSTSLSLDDSLLLAAGNDEKGRIWALKPQPPNLLQATVKGVGSEVERTFHSLTDILPFGKKPSAPPTPSTSPHGAPHPPKILHTLTGHTSKIYAGVLDVDPSQSSGRAYTGSYDRTVRVWDIHTGQQVRKVLCGSSVNSLSLSSGRVGVPSALLASAHLDSHVRVWSAEGGSGGGAEFSVVADMDSLHHQQVTGVTWGRGGTLLASTSRDHTVQLVDVRTWQSLASLEGPDKDPYRNLVNWNKPAFSPDGAYVVVGGHKGTLYIWHVDTGKCVTTLNPKQGYDGTVGSLGGEEAAQGAQAPQTAIVSVDWNRNGRQLISADLAGNVYFWGE